jgi:hypothetical protein
VDGLHQGTSVTPSSITIANSSSVMLLILSALVIVKTSFHIRPKCHMEFSRQIPQWLSPEEMPVILLNQVIQSLPGIIHLFSFVLRPSEPVVRGNVFISGKRSAYDF